MKAKCLESSGSMVYIYLGSVGEFFCNSSPRFFIIFLTRPLSLAGLPLLIFQEFSNLHIKISSSSYPKRLIFCIIGLSNCSLMYSVLYVLTPSVSKHVLPDLHDETHPFSVTPFNFFHCYTNHVVYYFCTVPLITSVHIFYMLLFTCKHLYKICLFIILHSTLFFHFHSSLLKY